MFGFRVVGNLINSRNTKLRMRVQDEGEVSFRPGGQSTLLDSLLFRVAEIATKWVVH